MTSPNGRRHRAPPGLIARLLGPGLVTGAADDDPSGIATYSQAGAHFGYGLLWTVFLTTPFMIAIQLVSAIIGRVTGQGIVANVKIPVLLIVSVRVAVVFTATLPKARPPLSPITRAGGGVTEALQEPVHVTLYVPGVAALVRIPTERLPP